DVRNAPPVFRRGGILLAGQLLARGYIPKTEFRFQAPVALPGHATGHQRLRVDGLPVLELRRGIDVDDLVDVGRLVDRCEQAAALEVVGDDLRHVDADVAVRGRAAHEVRDRDRQRLEFALGNDDALLGGRAPQAAPRHHTKRSHSGNDLSPAQAKWRLTQSIFVGHVVTSFVSRFRSSPPGRTQLFSVNTGEKYFHSSKKAAGKL